jgi:hypothetical protein
VKSTVFVVLAGLLSTAIAQSSWERNYGGPGYEQADCVRQTSDGGYIAACSTNDTALINGEVWLVKTNADGDTLWTRLYGGAGSDHMRSVRQTPDGGYVLAGSTASYGNGLQAWLMKTDSLGSIVWSKFFGGAGFESFLSAQPTMDGGYVAVGSTTSFGDSSQVYLVKTNGSGDSLWARVYGGARGDGGSDVQQTRDSGYAIVGSTNSFGDSWQAYLVKVLANGDPAWSKTYGGDRDEAGNSVQQTFDGGYVIAGFTNSFADSLGAAYLIKTNASGDTLWTRTFGGASGENASSVQQTRDTGYILAGVSLSFGDSEQVYLVRTNASGGTLWTRTFGGTGFEQGNSVQQTSDDGYVIAGATNSFGNRNQAYLIKTEPDGLVEIEETPRVEVRATTLPTIVRGVLWLAPASGCRLQASGLLDISGRRVVELRAGANDIRHLVPGVYFVRSASGVMREASSAVTKVIVTR